MALRPYKFLVIPVVQLVDEHGVVVDEAQPERPDIVFGIDGLRAYVDGFEDALAARAAAQSNGGQ